MSTKKITSAKIISERLKLLFEETGVKKGIIAERIGVKGSSISQWLSGETAATPQSIMSLAREFKVEEEWLAYGTGQKEKKFEVTQIFEPEQKKAQFDPFDELILSQIQPLSKIQKSEIIKYLTENFSDEHN